MDSGVRWLAALIVAVAIVALVAFARGEPDRAPRSASASASASVAAELSI